MTEKPGGSSSQLVMAEGKLRPDLGGWPGQGERLLGAGRGEWGEPGDAHITITDPTIYRGPQALWPLC